MKKIITLLTLLSLASISLLAQPCILPPPAGNPQMGAMIEPQFSNLWKQAKVSDEHGTKFKDGTASIGHDGWTVNAVNHNFRFEWNEIQPKLKNGDIIKVKFKGTAAQVGLGIEACVVQNTVSANGFTTCEVKITNEANPNGFVFQLKNRCTDIEFMRPGYNFGDSRLLTDDYISHVAHWGTFRYMNLLSANSNFGQTWVKRVSPNAPAYINQYEWSFPDCYDPNSNYQRFSEDMTPAIAGANNGMWSPGAPWETLIDISNYANKDMWINIPVMADDNYVLQLSKLIKQRLKPSLNVHVEIGSELWNPISSFMGFYMQRQILADEWLQKDPEKLKILGGTYCPGCELVASDLGRDRTSCNYDDWEAMTRWMARRLKEMMEQFATDWGWKEDGGVGGRIRATLAGQDGYASEGYAWNIRPGLEFLTKAYGADAPAKYLYSVSIRSYFWPREPDGKFTANLSVNQIIQNYSTYPMNYIFGEYAQERWGGANSNQWAIGNQVEGVFAIAKMCGLKMQAYEGGNELGDGGSTGYGWFAYDNANAVIKDPRFGTANTTLLNEWYSRYGDDALFIKNGDYIEGKNAYGMSETLNENNALRQSYINVATNPAPPRSNATRGVLGATTVTILDARKHASYPEYWDVGYFYGVREKYYNTVVNTDYTFKSDDNFTAPMLIYCEKPGTYKLELERSQMGSKVADDNFPTYCDIYLNEKLIKSGVRFGLKTFSRQLLDAIDEPFYWWTESVDIDIPFGVQTLRVRPSKPTAARPGNLVALLNGDLSHRFTNYLGLMSYRFTLETECQPPLGTETVKAVEAVTLYPNPTDGVVQLQFATVENIQSAYLLDIQGKRLKNFPQIATNIQIDISDLADGCYTLVVNTDKGSVVKRIVKIK